MIPLINVLSAATLTWFGGRKVSPTDQLLHTVRALVTNPPVLGCLGGMVYARFVHWFPAFLDNTLRMASYVTLPLALISIGGALSLEGMRTHLRLSLTASIFKLAILPVIGFVSMKAMGLTGQPFQVGMIFFALPTSTALYILSSQLNSDTGLAAAAIALSTLLSVFLFPPPFLFERSRRAGGLLGHSDADVLLHAITDALLGAARLGDIGRLFPDSDARHKDVDSLELLRIAAGKVRAAGWTVANIDAVVIAQRPRIAPYVPQMQARIAQVLGD